MTERETSTLTIRGVDYTVSEMSGKDMRGMRVLLASEKDKPRVEAWLVSACCVAPKFTEAEAFELPQFVVAKLSNEILRMTNGVPVKDGEEDAKNV
jgi:hypothetical protein